MIELHLPVVVGASQIGDPHKPGGRVTGPPSQKIPILRDLAAAVNQRPVEPCNNIEITIEVDTEARRYTGLVQSVGREVLVISSSLRNVEISTRIPLAKIIAFRVLKVEAEDLPAILNV